MNTCGKGKYRIVQEDNKYIVEKKVLFCWRRIYFPLKDGTRWMLSSSFLDNAKSWIESLILEDQEKSRKKEKVVVYTSQCTECTPCCPCDRYACSTCYPNIRD